MGEGARYLPPSVVWQAEDREGAGDHIVMDPHHGAQCEGMELPRLECPV